MQSWMNFFPPKETQQSYPTEIHYCSLGWLEKKTARTAPLWTLDRSLGLLIRSTKTEIMDPSKSPIKNELVSESTAKQEEEVGRSIV